MRLSKTGIINVAELYVWKRDGTELVNLADGKSVTGDNTHFLGNLQARNLITGRTDFHGMVHTVGPDAALKSITVDLNAETDIDGLLLINRQDCCGERTVGLKVEVLDANKNAIVTTTINEEHSAYVLDLAAGAGEWKSVSGAGQSSNFNWKPLVPAAPVAAPAEAVAVAQPKNVQGRYVRLSKTGIINVAELYVWKRDGTELVNLADGKSVTGDNTHFLGNLQARNLITGRTDFHGMVHTVGSDAALKSITVDLNAETDIDGLLLINRQDCCGERTVGLKVEVLDANKNAIVTTTINEEHSAYVLDLAAGAGEWKSVSGAGQSSNFNWKPLVPAAPVAAPAEAVAVAQPKNVQGRYVRLSKTGIINVAELYVWKRDGTELVNLADGKSVTGDNTHFLGNLQARNLITGRTDFHGMVHTVGSDAALKSITVDLNAETDIDGLLLINRQDCCGERTVGLKVEVLDANKNAIVTTTINEEHSAYVLDLAAGAGEWKSVSGAGQSSNFNWKPLVPAAPVAAPAEAVAVAQPKNVQGRYVRLSKTGIINLNELYVWKRDGTELVNLAAGKSVTGDSPEHESGNFHTRTWSTVRVYPNLFIYCPNMA